jgi:hypothetical protein
MAAGAALKGASVATRVANEAPASVRELVQRLATSHGLLFAPRPGRTAAGGLPLFQLGQLNVYFESGVIFGRAAGVEGAAAAGGHNSGYRPLALEELPQLAFGAS